MKILIVENGFNDLKKSRISLGSYFQSAGNEVFYACPDPKEDGIYGISMSRNSLAPVQLFNGFVRLSRLEKENDLQAVLSFRLIPNVLNYFASFRNVGVKRVAVITGLGYAFIEANTSVRTVFQRNFIKLFYRIASKRILIISQNSDDLVDLGVENGEVVLGSGIESKGFKAKKELDTCSIKLLYVGRLLKSKGILTAIEVFEKLQGNNEGATLTIAGSIDEDNPDSITEAELTDLKKKQGVYYRGFVNDMDSVYEKSNVLLFPSTYREGVPRVILESLKHGLTIVTSDMPGCKETVKENGFLITDNTGVSSIIEYISSLDSKKLLENHMRSKELFQTTFSSDIIYPQYLSHLL